MIIEKCNTCEGSGHLFKIREYNISPKITIKRKRIKICSECNGTDIIQSKATNDDLKHVKAH